MRPDRPHGAPRGAGRTALAAVIAAALAATGALVLPTPAGADTAPATGVPAPDSADALPTVQIDGVVWSQAVVGTTVYAGGKFATARPAGAAPGTRTVARRNLLAYDLRTGALISSFAPQLNGQVVAVAVSPDRKRLYVGGDFTTVGSSKRYRLAAFDTATRALVAAFHPSLDARVSAIAATNTRVYVGGTFSTVNGNKRARLAALNATNGKLLSWRPAADAGVKAMVLTPDAKRLVVGGQFTRLGTTAAYGLGALDAITGATKAFAANAVVRNAGKDAGITSLTTDGKRIYGTGYVWGEGGNLEGAFAAEPATGKIVWIQDCHGDHYSGFAHGAVYYAVGHAHTCATLGGFPEVSPRAHHPALAFTTAATGTLKHNTQPRYADFGGRPSPSLLTWFPTLTQGTYTGQSQAAWHVTGTRDYVVLGGEFVKVNGRAQQGLVRFAVRSLAPNKVGPSITGGHIDLAGSSPAAGTARLTWTTNHDRDNLKLTYRVLRSGLSTPVQSSSLSYPFWDRRKRTVTETGLAPGTYRYRVVVSDPLGNSTPSDWVSVTVG